MELFVLGFWYLVTPWGVTSSMARICISCIVVKILKAAEVSGSHLVHKQWWSCKILQLHPDISTKKEPPAWGGSTTEFFVATRT